MYVNATQIKQALIDIANETPRPHFEVSVVRDVVEAIKCDKPHHLKESVLEKIKVDLQDRVATKDSEQMSRLKCLREVCTGESVKQKLGEDSGLGFKYINHMVRGRYEINDNVWIRLEPLIKALKDLKS